MATFRHWRYHKGKFGLSIRLDGLEQARANLATDGEAWRRVQQALIDGMIENAEDLLGRAQKLAPIKEGPLRGSGSCAVYANGRAVSRRGLTEVKPGTFQLGERQAPEGGLGDAVVGEVGFNMPYALMQHEREDFRHPKGGQAKYLSTPLNERAGRYARNLADHVGRVL